MTTAPGSGPRNDPSFIGAVQDDWSMFSDDPTDYTVGAPIGFGASSIVYSAAYVPQNGSSKNASIPCALKVLDLDKLPQSALHLLTRETRLMSLSKHPNVLRVRGSWMVGHKVYIALRLMRKGSVRDVMRYRHIDGVEEEVLKCILKQALQGLNYLHINGFIHRDIKAANLLVDDDGTVLLGDLGVAASLSDDPVGLAPLGYESFSSTSSTMTQPSVTPSPNQRPHYGRRKSFVGTPCWMAPEVVAQKTGYNASADIYSLGITALELAHGRAPHSLDPPHKALMKTLQNASPTLDRVGGANKYSRALKEIIDSCLSKDPSLRPSAAELLALPYFKSAKKKDYLIGTLLTGLPPLAVRQERRKTAMTLTSSSIASSWDFNPSIFMPPSPSHHTRNLNSSSPARRARSILPSESVFPMDDEIPSGLDEANCSDCSGADDEPRHFSRGRQAPQDASGRYPSPLPTPPLASPRRSAPVKAPLLSPPMSPVMRSTSMSQNEPVLHGTTSNRRWKKLAGRIGAAKPAIALSPPEKPSSGGISSSTGVGGSLTRTSSRILGRSRA